MCTKYIIKLASLETKLQIFKNKLNYLILKYI